MEPMTENEIRAFLLEEPAHTGKLATVRESGRPHVIPIWYLLEGEYLVFTTWHETVKAANLERQPWAALCVDDERPPFRFVMVEGPVEIEKEAEDLLSWTTRLAGRYMGHDLADRYGRRNAVAGEWLIWLRMERMLGRREVAVMAGDTARFRLRPLGPQDEEWVMQYVAYHWGDEQVVAHGQVYLPHTLPGFVAEGASDQEGGSGEPLGLVTYRVEGDACEIVTLNSDLPGQGIGSALVRAVKEEARDRGCQRLWLVTTNDNLDALRFYQKEGFQTVAVHQDAVTRARQLKPAIPLVGEDGIPLRDEIELALSIE
ncbi:MAG: TIGR03618 family F420-dependent PPOX class oxidoreductase [Candidatus Promineifilaceae bacterium]|nr:TIGR03618 family F420-dependent PPOX class oxidoreductase [Candidatus Promineifilaceae bacterium]